MSRATVGPKTEVYFVDFFMFEMYNINVDKNRVEMLPPASLAFIGDAVYTLYVRRRVVSDSDGISGTLHTECTKYVNAKAQSAVFDALVTGGKLTQAESEIARRAKNAHLHSRAKTATSVDYHKATALEAVIGYLDLSGEADRLEQILELCAAAAGLPEVGERE